MERQSFQIKRLRQSQTGGMVLAGVVLLALAATTVAYIGVGAQNMARRTLIRGFARDALAFSVGEGVVAQVTQDLMDYSQANGGDLDNYFSLGTTQRTITYPKGRFIIPYTSTQGVEVVSSPTPSSTMTATPAPSLPLILAPESDPIVIVSKAAHGSYYNQVNISYSLCTKVIAGRTNFSSGDGLGVNWTPACDAGDIMQISKTYYLNFRADVLTGTAGVHRGSTRGSHH